MINFKRFAVAVAVALLCAGTVQARDVFSIDANINSQQKTFGFDSFDGVADFFTRQNLQREFPGYNETSPASSSVDFRGLGVGLAFVGATSELRFTVPGLQITESFNGANRDESIRLFKNFMKDNGRGVLERILKELARVSPIDALAGNPNSLQSKQAEGDFKRGFTKKKSQIWGCGSTARGDHQQLAMNGLGCPDELYAELNPVELAANGVTPDVYSAARDRVIEKAGENEIMFGVSYAHIETAGYETDSITVPFSYTWRFDEDPARRLQLLMPLGYTDAAGAAVYAFGLGLAYTHPMSDKWLLTPAIGYSITGSEDLAAAGDIASFSLASAYTMRLKGWALNIGNAVGRYQTIGVSFGDFSADPGLANMVFTNGIMISGPDRLIAKDLVVEYHLTDTRYTGDDIYAEYYDEIGVSIGRLGTEDGRVTSLLKGGISYLWGDKDVKGFKVDLSYRF